MTQWQVTRVYLVSIPDDPAEYNDAINWMCEQDPEIATANNGKPDPIWLRHNLIDMLTREADTGTEVVEREYRFAIMGASEVSTTYESLPPGSL